ncbi:MAG: AAA family ATPase [Pseudomonadota bacterium]
MSVSGFRSLKSFNMKILPGLNMLVGPNGSGKTNIIMFFEFLSSIMQMSLSDAVSASGGAMEVFSRSRKSETFEPFSASVSGNFRSVRRDSHFVRYRYSFEVMLSEDRDQIFFRSQELKISRSKDKKIRTKWDLHFKSTADPENINNVKVQIITADLRKISSPRYTDSDFSARPRTEKITAIENVIARFSDGENSIVMLPYGLLDEVRELPRDFIGGEAFNIMPAAARLPDDGATKPGVRKDGSGLAATLYALKKFDQNTGIRRRSRPYYGPAPYRRNPYDGNRDFRPKRRSFSQIKELANLVNSEIHDLDIQLDHRDNKIKVHTTMATTDGELSLPFSFLSDGTVKWIALVTAIFTYRSIFAIEEPENFIHPLMQQ